jgi:hypothetical protein
MAAHAPPLPSTSKRKLFSATLATALQEPQPPVPIPASPVHASVGTPSVPFRYQLALIVADAREMGVVALGSELQAACRRVLTPDDGFGVLVCDKSVVCTRSLSGFDDAEELQPLLTATSPKSPSSHPPHRLVSAALAAAVTEIRSCVLSNRSENHCEFVVVATASTLARDDALVDACASVLTQAPFARIFLLVCSPSALPTSIQSLHVEPCQYVLSFTTETVANAVKSLRKRTQALRSSFVRVCGLHSPLVCCMYTFIKVAIDESGEMAASGQTSTHVHLPHPITPGTEVMLSP